jgi:hypothetical protein
LANEWNAAFPHLNAAIKKGARVLFTSRNYVYFTARSEIKESAFPLIKESQVVIHVDKMTIAEREQILYNHIKLGDQNPYCKRKLKPFLVGVAANKHFLPEIARRLGNKIFTRSLELKEGGIKEFVERPISFLVEVLRSLDSDSRAAIALVFMNGGAMASPLDLVVRSTRRWSFLVGHLRASDEHSTPWMEA